MVVNDDNFVGAKRIPILLSKLNMIKHSIPPEELLTLDVECDQPFKG